MDSMRWPSFIHVLAVELVTDASQDRMSRHGPDRDLNKVRPINISRHTAAFKTKDRIPVSYMTKHAITQTVKAPSAYAKKFMRFLTASQGIGQLRLHALLPS